MKKGTHLFLMCFIPLFLFSIPSGSTPLSKTYHSPERVNSILKTWESEYSQICDLFSIGKSTSGNPLWILQIASEKQDLTPTEKRPAALISANIEGDHLIGTEAALNLAEKMLSQYGKDEKISNLLDSRTIYIAPLLNPDAAQYYFKKPLYQRSWNERKVDEDLDDLLDEDGFDDLNSDGFITEMRVKDPEGEWIQDPSDPFFMRKADPKKGEKGIYKLMTEGLDNDGDGEINEDPPGGVELNRNFPHDYEYHVKRAGLYPISEVETIALVEFLIDRPNIAMVLNYSSENTFLNLQQTGKAQAAERKVTVPERYAEFLGLEPEKEYEIDFIIEVLKGLDILRGVEIDESLVAMIFGLGPAMSIDNADKPYFESIQTEYKEALKEKGLNYPVNRAKGVNKGSFAAYCYFQAGVQVFSSDLWAVPEPEKEPKKDVLTIDQLKSMSSDEFIALGEEKIDEFLKEQGVPPNYKASAIIEMVKAGRLDPQKMAEMLAQMPKKPAVKEGEHPDSYILQWAKENREDKGFIEWQSFEHPTLGEVEIGGFIPYLKKIPPLPLAKDTLEFHADFYIDLLNRLPELKLDSIEVETIGDGLYEVRFMLTNPGWFPTSPAQGRRARAAWPIRIELDLSESQILFSGERIINIPFIIGSGGLEKAEWTIRAKKGSKLWIKASSPRLGEVKTQVVLE